MKNEIRSILSGVTRHTPLFRGKGRMILFLDKFLTNYSDPYSYLIQGKINDRALFEFDIRAWGQKFAYYYGEWEKSYVSILERLYLGRGGAFIDIGSSLGLYVCCLGKLVKDHGNMVLSIEPIPFNLDRQQHNVNLNKGLSKIVSYFPIALGSKDGSINLHADPIKADNNAFVANDGAFKVDIHRLDDVISDLGFPDVGAIKIDVEGWEPEVILGSRETIKKNKPIIFGEFHRGRMSIYGFDMKETSRLLVDELGYTVCILGGNDSLRKISNIGIYENIFFLPDESLIF